MADYSFKQGEDKKILLVVSKDGTHLDISAATKIMAKMLINDVFAKNYSLTPEADYGTLEVDGTNNFQVNLFVERSDSKIFPVGVISIALDIEFIDTTFPAGTRTEEYSFRVGRVLVGQGMDLDL